MRLDAFLSRLKYGSRKDVKKIIKNQRVSVDKQIINDPKFQIDPNKNEVFIDQTKVVYMENIMILMHKPSGYECTHESTRYPTVYDLLKEEDQRYPLEIVGRLDQDTEGLVLLTDNTKLLHQIISPSSNTSKMYFVEVDDPFDAKLLETETIRIRNSKNELYQPKKCQVDIINDNSFYLTIKEGKFHQVKRMVEFFNRNVIYLKRISIGEYSIDGIEKGTYKKVQL
jgi:16S rRNA pseudouridine516 synthase